MSVDVGFDSDCLMQTPVWSPDGRSLYWEQRCGAQSTIMKGDLFTNNSAQDRWAVWAQ